MGFVLSILYFAICYLTPVGLFGPPVAPFRIELVLAFLILAISLPRMITSFVTKTPQALALAGMATAVFLSMLIGMHWPSGAVSAVFTFIPAIYAYFLVCLHCNSRGKLKVIVLMLLFVCIFVIIQGNLELVYNTNPQPTETLEGDVPGTVTLNAPLWNGIHPYLVAQQTAPWKWIYRVRGLGLINDPNDFGQLLVCEIPLLFLFWRRKRGLLNFAFVILPVCVLLYGIYLTHSRGALLALVAVVLVAARRRIGTIASVVVAGGLFAGAMALQFTGGRAISEDAGSDRTALWGEGLQLLKSHPIFGVGMGQMSGLTDSFRTAHNSIVVCAAELGLLGLFFWSFFLMPTARDVFLIAMPNKVGEAVNAEGEEDQPLLNVWRGAALDKKEINHLGTCLLLSLTGFLVAGWFLSRAYAMTFFLLGGMVEVVYEAARREGMIAPRLKLKRTLLYSAVLTICLVAMVYAALRILNLMH